MSDTSMIHTERALVKVIEDPTSVRLKICPRVVYDDSLASTEQGPEYFEVQETDDGPRPLETDLSWNECNLLIKALRRHRDRVHGTPA
jgi:hypothetical protein